MTMFTKTFTLDRHIEELRAELRGTACPEEAREIRAELQDLQSKADVVGGDARSDS
jgi:hypothetical protein